jgi:hypothetical protein
VATPDFYMAAHQGSNRLVASADGQGPSCRRRTRDPCRSLAHENRIGEETTDAKAILKAQQTAQKNNEIRQQVIDEFQSRSTYLSSVAAAATPYQDALAPAQQLYWQQILDATGAAADNQVSYLADLIAATSQSDVAYALAVHAAEASQAQADQAAALAFQAAQSQARANYQNAVAGSDAALTATIDAAIALHDLAVANLQDGLQAAHADAWATTQTLVHFLDAHGRQGLHARRRPGPERLAHRHHASSGRRSHRSHDRSERILGRIDAEHHRLAG